MVSFQPPFLVFWPIRDRVPVVRTFTPSHPLMGGSGWVEWIDYISGPPHCGVGSPSFGLRIRLGRFFSSLAQGFNTRGKGLVYSWGTRRGAYKTILWPA